MKGGSFVLTSEAVIFTIKCWKIIIIDGYLSGGQYFVCVSGDVVGDILKYNGIKPQKPILLLTPMCQDTPCQILAFLINLCRCSALIYAFR